jgi:hypothetical protein
MIMIVVMVMACRVISSTDFGMFYCGLARPQMIRLHLSRGEQALDPFLPRPICPAVAVMFRLTNTIIILPVIQSLHDSFAYSPSPLAGSPSFLPSFLPVFLQPQFPLKSSRTHIHPLVDLLRLLRPILPRSDVFPNIRGIGRLSRQPLNRLPSLPRCWWCALPGHQGIYPRGALGHRVLHKTTLAVSCSQEHAIDRQEDPAALGEYDGREENTEPKEDF